MDRIEFTRLAQRTYEPTEVREFFLPDNSVLRIDDGAGALLTVTLGSVWLTQDGEGTDRVLGVGSVFRLDRDGTCLVTAFRRSAVALAMPLDTEPRGRKSARSLVKATVLDGTVRAA